MSLFPFFFSRNLVILLLLILLFVLKCIFRFFLFCYYCCLFLWTKLLFLFHISDVLHKNKKKKKGWSFKLLFLILCLFFFFFFCFRGRVIALFSLLFLVRAINIQVFLYTYIDLCSIVIYKCIYVNAFLQNKIMISCHWFYVDEQFIMRERICILEKKWDKHTKTNRTRKRMGKKMKVVLTLMLFFPFFFVFLEEEEAFKRGEDWKLIQKKKKKRTRSNKRKPKWHCLFSYFFSLSHDTLEIDKNVLLLIIVISIFSFLWMVPAISFYINSVSTNKKQKQKQKKHVICFFVFRLSAVPFLVSVIVPPLFHIIFFSLSLFLLFLLLLFFHVPL